MPRRHADLGLCDGIGGKFVSGKQARRKAEFFMSLRKQLHGRGPVPAWLNQDVENITFVVNCAPQTQVSAR